MGFITENQLKSKATYQLSDSADRKLAKSASNAQLTVFLSHSHLDSNIAEGMKNSLAEIGMNLYVDWEDTDMPSETNYQTALRLKNKIRELDYFILLATNNAIKSRWVPWELGVADGYKSYDKILIIPVSDDNGQYDGNEYLQVYKRIEFGSLGKLIVYDPKTTYTGTLVESYLKK